ncbi:bZIP transcription factor-like protein [Pyrenochaeta sp. MPI-SDFR-AT-0127]|nr:bZIP transcription factor-like protein [Pyrenochaeta sp. MPI-SDFR-AT-0127]
MSAYKGHRGPNVSQYIANLNQLSPPQDLLADPAPVEEDFSAFLNADFFDVNNGRNVSVDFTTPLDFDVDLAAEPDQQPKTGAKLPHSTVNTSAGPNMDFNLNSDFQFTDFNHFGPNPILDSGMQGLPQPQSNQYSLPPTYASPTSSISPAGHGFDEANKKRKLDDVLPIAHQSLDENVRVAAEEDKRRRNTAASARFRVKKKQREQALEKTAKDMSDKVNLMEVRIQQLETENAWLKGLITEKNGGKSSTTELRALLSKHEEANHGRSSPAHTDGVGTKSSGTKADA